MTPGSWAGRAWRATAPLILAAGLHGPALAQEDHWPFGDPDERQRQLEPGPSLPESINGVVRPGDAERVPKINTLSDIFRTLQACWRPPAGSGFSGQEITVSIAFKRNGDVLGKPRITYYKEGGDRDRREAFTRSVRDAFERCTPLPFSDKLGSAVAGRIFTFRFSDTRPM